MLRRRENVKKRSVARRIGHLRFVSRPTPEAGVEHIENFRCLESEILIQTLAIKTLFPLVLFYFYFRLDSSKEMHFGTPEVNWPARKKYRIILFGTIFEVQHSFEISLLTTFVRIEKY